MCSSDLVLFRNTENGFKNVSQQSGPVFSKSIAARGMAMGDFNNDGHLDVVVVYNSGIGVVNLLLGTGTGTFSARPIARRPSRATRMSS